MTDVLRPPASPSPLPSPPSERAPSIPSRPRPRERLSSYAHSQRMSAYSTTSRPSPSRPASTIPFPQFQSALAYTLVRDFAWPAYHPLHHGVPEASSGQTTPGSEWNGGRRLSDPVDLASSTGSDSGNGGSNTGGGWSAGPWGGDGVMSGYPEHTDMQGHHESLPATSFGEDVAESEAADGSRRRHRKSKSYASISDYERGRRRESAGYRRSRASGEANANDIFRFGASSSSSSNTGLQSDPAGRDGLRQSRSYGAGSSTGLTPDNGRGRADSHFQSGLLPNRAYPNNGTAPRRSTSTGALASPGSGITDASSENDPLPLDSEPHLDPGLVETTQRESIGPLDEELYAGRSLALYSFEPENSNELRLREGQVVMVAYRHGQGWLVAEDAETGEQGLVPEEYVRLLSELPHFDERTGRFIEGEGEVEGLEGDEVEEGEDSLMQEAEHVASPEHGNGGAGAGKKKEELRVDEAYVRTPSRETAR
ncbi:hypothetical protein LTR62_008823 [Meristemomyces frigidus]|uniref:SH3 domain-containing protein n=1 Tax=Meristemomyces frigidus TaxID=1508187 RepID=A0AAN7YLM7_9PEZI|nr:hypothetical protein LTR62_008823 [Meristemomyces frigidus]